MLLWKHTFDVCDQPMSILDRLVGDVVVLDEEGVQGTGVMFPLHVWLPQQLHKKNIINLIHKHVKIICINILK